MDRQNTTGAYKLIEVLAVLFIVLILVALLLPGFNLQRERGRRTTCLNNMHALGMAMQNYASYHNDAFPPSASLQVDTPAPGQNKVAGWSFLVTLLPYMECNSLYRSVPIDKGDPIALLAAKDASTVAASNTLIHEFTCPSNNNNIFLYCNTTPASDAFTNYKVMSASTSASLGMVANPGGTPPYGTAAMHPDGAIYPGTGTTLKDLDVDGLSHTIMLMETQDDKASRWIVGAEMSLVGLPNSSSPRRGKTPEESNGDKNYPYFAPPGYDGVFGDNAGVNKQKPPLRTFLEMDFSPSGRDIGLYEDQSWTSVKAAYGPSSAHPVVVITGFADGNARTLSKNVDAANLFFLITKAEMKPFNLP